MRSLRYSFRVIGLCAAVAVGALIADEAGAQQYPYFDTTDPNVVIDLSVINDGGFGARSFAPGVLPPAGGGKSLLVPGPEVPVSRILASPGGEKIQLRQPDPVAVPDSTETAADTAPPPAKAPFKAKVAKSMDLPPPPIGGEPESAKKSGKPADIAPVNVASKSMDKAPPPPSSIIEKSPPPAAQMTAPPPPSSSVIKAPMPPAPSSAVEKSPSPPPPPPPVAAQITAPPVKQQQASLPAAGSPLTPGRAMRVTFGADATMLPAEAKGPLDALAVKLKEKEETRLQLLAYAGGGGLSSSKARRLALSRALAVRSYLIEVGVNSTRIDVRALGDKAPDEPMNRVDLNIIDR